MMAAAENKKTNKPKKSIKAELYDWAESLAISLAVVMFIFSFCFKTVEVYGPSMDDTLNGRPLGGYSDVIGDKLLITKLFYTPAYGDIVVIDSKTEGSIVKRVIATEGQQVDIDFAEGVVFVDGEQLFEPYAKTPTTNAGDVSFPVTVPEGCVFVLGDNRAVSLDSRYHSIGMVDTDDIEGKAILRIYPFDRFGQIE